MVEFYSTSNLYLIFEVDFLYFQVYRNSYFQFGNFEKLIMV